MQCYTELEHKTKLGNMHSFKEIQVFNFHLYYVYFSLSTAHIYTYFVHSFHFQLVKYNLIKAEPESYLPNKGHWSLITFEVS